MVSTTVTQAPLRHELVHACEERGFQLNETLTAMLGEHHSHRTERRGCGYTQATRHLAEYIDQPLRYGRYDDVRLFAGRDPGTIPALLEREQELGGGFGWRNLDQGKVPEGLMADAAYRRLLAPELERQRVFRGVPSWVALEESKLIARMMRDILLPVDERPGRAVLHLWPERLAIGTCPLAEKYFLELADGFVRRRGRVNVIIDEDGEPVLLEKLHLGDDHSCVSVKSCTLNGVELPPGSLFGVHYDAPEPVRENAELPGVVYRLRDCAGFRFLRLTTLAVSPANRARAFTRHFEAQVKGALFAPGEVTIEQLRAVAWRQLGGGAP